MVINVRLVVNIDLDFFCTLYVLSEDWPGAVCLYGTMYTKRSEAEDIWKNFVFVSFFPLLRSGICCREENS